MMKRNGRANRIAALLLTLALGQVSAVTAWAGAPQISGKLLTSGNVPILVNGNSAGGGTTILSGAVIETPDNVSATIQLPGLGELELAPGSIAVLEFTPNGIKVTMKKGCSVVNSEAGTKASVVDEKGNLLATTGQADKPAQSDGSKAFRLPACAGLIVAATAATGAAVAGGATAGAGLSTTVIAAITAAVAAPAVLIPVVLMNTGGSNSPMTP